MEDTWWTKPEQLDNDQRRVVALARDGDHLIIGPPGSGKTNLLLLRASYLHRLGRRSIVVLTFNRLLREFLVTGTAATPFDVQKIQTYVNWASQLLRQTGEEIDSRGNFEIVRKRVNDALSGMPAAAIDESKLDTVLLDESQDYTEQEIRLIKRSCVNLYAVGDDRQRIYRTSGALAALEQICGEPKRLWHNYRNGLKICRVADSIRNELGSRDGLEARSQYDEQAIPSSVILASGLSLEQQAERAVDEIATQLRAYPSGMIGILAPMVEVVRRVASILEGTALAPYLQIELYESGYRPLTADRRIVATTIHAAKGLEFRAVHLFGVDTLSRFRLERKLAYTGITRAKTSLSIYGGDTRVPGYIEQALTTLEPGPAREPDLSELFTRDSR